MDSKENLREQESLKILKDLKDSHDLSLLAEEIKDNKITFEYKGITHRVRLLNRKEKEEFNNLRLRKFGQLLKDKDILLEADLKQIYKERGIDIEAIDEDIKKIFSEKFAQELKLGEAIENKSGDAVLKTYKDKIQELVDKSNLLMINRSHLLSHSLENQLLAFATNVLIYLSVEKQLDSNWVRVFKTYEEFENYEDEKFIEIVGYKTLLLQGGATQG